MSITVQIVGADMADVYRAFDLLELRLSDLALAGYLRATMEPFLQERAEDRFRMEGDDASGRWLPLSPVTRNIRQTSGFPPDSPINRRTGELEDYITQSPGAVGAAPGGIQLTYPGSTPSGPLYTKVETAQRGKPSPRTQPRPVLAVGAYDMAFFQLSLVRYIQTG